MNILGIHFSARELGDRMGVIWTESRKVMTLCFFFLGAIFFYKNIYLVKYSFFLKHQIFLKITIFLHIVQASNQDTKRIIYFHSWSIAKSYI
jgi:hypothetical protein